MNYHLWIIRCASRYNEILGLTYDQSIEAAKIAKEEDDKDNGYYRNDPEGCADADMERI